MSKKLYGPKIKRVKSISSNKIAKIRNISLGHVDTKVFYISEISCFNALMVKNCLIEVSSMMAAFYGQLMCRHAHTNQDGQKVVK